MKSEIKLFLDALNCNHTIYYSRYDASHTLTETYPQDIAYNHLFLRQTRVLSILDQDQTAPFVPYIFSGASSIFWIAVKEDQNTFHLLGPMMEQSLSEEGIMRSLGHVPVLAGSVMETRKLIQHFLSYPVIPTNLRDQYSLMFSFFISGRQYKDNDIIRASYNDPNDTGIVPFSDPQTPSQISYNEAFRFIREIYTSIIEGNLSYIIKLNERANSLAFHWGHTTDALKEQRNSLMLFLGICSYASMVAGVVPETAYQMIDHYMILIDQYDSSYDLSHLSLEIYQAFVEKAHEYLYAGRQVPTHIYQAQEYIKLHIEEPLSLKKIASHFNYTEYYFSRKFKEECGITVGEYIKQQKVEYSKLLLQDPNLSVSQISELLCFCSVSHYSATFQKYVHMSPSDYRKHNGQM